MLKYTINQIKERSSVWKAGRSDNRRSQPNIRLQGRHIVKEQRRGIVLRVSVHQVIRIILSEFLICIPDTIKKLYMIVPKLEKHILSGLLLLV